MFFRAKGFQDISGASSWHTDPPPPQTDTHIHKADQGEVDWPVDGYPAQSSWRVMEMYPPPPRAPVASLVQVMPKQGRKHQVRVHLHYLSSPMLLDPIYSQAGGRRSRRRDSAKSVAAKVQDGNRGESRTLAELLAQCTDTYKDGRFFLHSACLYLPKYALGESGAFLRCDEEGQALMPIMFAAPTPAWFQMALRTLQSL